jgi:hypothetical protein
MRWESAQYFACTRYQFFHFCPFLFSFLFKKTLGEWEPFLVYILEVKGDNQTVWLFLCVFFRPFVKRSSLFALPSLSLSPAEISHRDGTFSFLSNSMFEFCFYVLRFRTRFRRYWERRVQFSCFVFPDSFSTIEGHRVPFSCFALSDSFSAVPRASSPVFIFCTSKLVFGGSEGIKCSFHVLRSRTCFRRYRGRRVQFSYCALPNSFSSVPSASSPVFMFFAPRLVFCETEDVRSSFHVFCFRMSFRR